MLKITNFFLIGIYLFFPILSYITSITNTTNYSKEKDHFYLSIALTLCEVLLLVLSPPIYAYSLLFFTIPLLIAYITKNKASIINCNIILIIYFLLDKIYHPLLIILILLSYYLFYLLFSKKDQFSKLLINYYFLINALILCIYFYLFSKKIINFCFIFIALFITIIYLYLLIIILKKNEIFINLNNKLKELEKERRLKTSMFKLTHELKNPLAVCNGYLEMIDFQNENKTRRYFDILKDEIKRSLTIINDFSSFGKIKELDKEELDINYLLEEIKDTLRALYIKNNAEICIENDEEIYFIGDYSRLKQVFINLLKNALEAKNKAYLLVNIKVKELKEKIKIIIKDNGCGMTKEQLAHIGEIFYTTKSTGTGLGLSYCQEIIDLHGGQIMFKSQPDIGTTITIYLPK